MPGISKSQAEAIADGFLDQLGESKGDFKMITDFPVIEQILIELAASFILEVQKNIQRDRLGKSRVSTGAMFDDLSSGELQKTGDAYSISMGFTPGQPPAFYYDFINKGVSGIVRGVPGSPYKFKSKYPGRKMVDAIKKWIDANRRDIDLKEQPNLRKSRGGVSGGTLASARAAQVKRRKLSELEIKNSVAFAIATNIKKFGIQRSGFFDDAIKTIFTTEFGEAMAAAAGGDVALKIRKSI